MANIISLSEIGKRNSEEIGAKASYIGELMRSRLQVPEGFVVLPKVYKNLFRKENKINKILAETNSNNLQSLNQASKQISELILEMDFEGNIKKEISEAYEDLMISSEAKKAGSKVGELIKAGRDKPSISLRPSVQSSLKENSFSGVYSSEINVKGEENLMKQLKRIYLSSFSPLAIWYREMKSIPHETGLSVIVQRMVEGEKSGKILTQNPLKKNQMIIESIEGNGIELKQGNILPSIYFLNRRGEIDRKEIFNGELGRREVNRIFELARKIQRKFREDSEISWILNNGNIKIVGVKPLLKSYETRESSREEFEEDNFEEIRGISGSIGKGKVEGRMEIVESLDKNINNKIILTNDSFSDLIILASRNKGILSYNGGITSSLSSLAREFSIPLIFGVDEFEKLKGNRGVLNPKSEKIRFEKKLEHQEIESSRKFLTSQEPLTATEIRVKTSIPVTDKVLDEVDKADSVGFLTIKEGLHSFKDFSYRESSLESLTQKLYPKKIWVKIEPEEFEKNLREIKLLNQRGLDNLHLLLPSVNDLSELISFKEKLQTLPISVKRGAIIKTPAQAFQIKEICEEGIDLVFINLDSISRLMLNVSRVEHTFKNLAIKKLIEKIINDTKKYKVHASLFTKFPTNQELIDELVKLGVDSISVEPESLETVNRMVERSERKLLLERARNRMS